MAGIFPDRSVLIHRLGFAALIVALTVGTTHTQSPPPAGAFDPVGLQPDRGYFSQLPFEHVDMVNGTLILTFTDLVLPGNAGMNLRFIRTVLPRTAFSFTDVPVVVVHPGPPQLGEDGGNYPVFKEGDGTVHPTQPETNGFTDHVYLTEQFWRYDTNTRTLQLPDGRVATYESGDPFSVAYLVEVHDAYGNSITPVWEYYAPYVYTKRLVRDSERSRPSERQSYTDGRIRLQHGGLA
jgi:hypothetical protein